MCSNLAMVIMEVEGGGGGVRTVKYTGAIPLPCTYFLTKKLLIFSLNIESYDSYPASTGISVTRQIPDLQHLTKKQGGFELSIGRVD